MRTPTEIIDGDLQNANTTARTVNYGSVLFCTVQCTYVLYTVCVSGLRDIKESDTLRIKQIMYFSGTWEAEKAL